MRTEALIKRFLQSPKDHPALTGFAAGCYPLVFYYANNFESINSGQQLLFFGLVFLLAPTLLCWALYHLMGRFTRLAPYRSAMLLVFLTMVTAALFSQVYFMTLKKKMLAVLLLLVLFAALKWGWKHKKLLLGILLLTLMALPKLLLSVYHGSIGYDAKWLEQPAAVQKALLKSKPNIYLIEPDGYAGETAMNGMLYRQKNPFYDWLRSSGFTVYDNTRSNYPASLASNASMFAMAHHRSGNMGHSGIEIPNARAVIVAQNPSIQILKNNGYRTFFIAEDAYFQKNFKGGLYDHYNIGNSEIPFFSKDDVVKRDVFKDLLTQMERYANDSKPHFFFVEKLLPHHIHFDGTGKANERKVYLEKLAQSSQWLQMTVGAIEQRDPNALIIIASDHGGWVGLENFESFYRSKDPAELESIFGNLIAIKWGKTPVPEQTLQSNVNLFPLLFGQLSQRRDLFEKRDDAAYQYEDGLLSGSLKKVLPQ